MQGREREKGGGGEGGGERERERERVQKIGDRIAIPTYQRRENLVLWSGKKWTIIDYRYIIPTHCFPYNFSALMQTVNTLNLKIHICTYVYPILCMYTAVQVCYRCPAIIMHI